VPTLADLEYAYLGSLGATGSSLADRRQQIYGASLWAYFSARSGLAPVEKYSLADHQLAYFRAQAGITTGSLADAKTKFWSGSAPVITQQPSTTPQSLAVDAVLTLTSAASGIPAPTVQWQRSGDGGGSWNNIAGATNPTLNHTLSAANGYATAQTWLYRAVWTNIKGTATSNLAGAVNIT